MKVVSELIVRVRVDPSPRVIFPSTCKVVSKCTADPTSTVPRMSVFPLVERTVNLSVVPLVILKYLPVVSRVMSLWKTESSSTSSVLLKVTAASTSNVLLNVTPLSISSVPSEWMLPLSLSITNLSAVPSVIEKIVLGPTILTSSSNVVSELIRTVSVASVPRVTLLSTCRSP